MLPAAAICANASTSSMSTMRTRLRTRCPPVGPREVAVCPPSSTMSPMTPPAHHDEPYDAPGSPMTPPAHPLHFFVSNPVAHRPSSPSPAQHRSLHAIGVAMWVRGCCSHQRIPDIFRVPLRPFSKYHWRLESAVAADVGTHARSCFLLVFFLVLFIPSFLPWRQRQRVRRTVPERSG